MPGINKVILIGRVGKDPKTSFLPDGTAVTSFSVATSEEWKDKNTEEKKEKTTWHNCQAWRRLAEICGEYLKKGSLVYLEGKINNRNYQKDGETKYISEIVLSDMKMLGGKQERSPGLAPEQKKPESNEPIDSQDIPF